MPSPKKTAPKKKSAAKKKTAAPKKTAKKPESKKAPAKKKTPVKKTKPPEPPQDTHNFSRAIISIVLLTAIVFLAIFLSNYLQKKNNANDVETKTPVVRKKIDHQPPVFEVYSDDVNDHPVPDKVAVDSTTSQNMPLVAIIIDDVGYDRRLAKKLMNISSAITLSILPFSPHQKEIATNAKNNGTDVMLHLPMEPLKYPAIDSGKGTLLANMTPDELIEQLKKNIEDVPYIVGVNNHMGSKITANAPQIYQIFSILKKHNLFFVDSRTTNKSVCKPSARLFQIPFAERNVFLDNIQDKISIQKQFEKLVKIAERDGLAVGIGHAYKITCTVLQEEIPKSKNKVKFVPVSQVVRIIET